MEILENITVGEIVAVNYKAADVFKKYDIDFCCGGNKALSDVCNQLNINQSDVEIDLDNINDDQPGNHNFNRWKLDFLIDYILNEHHTYVSANVPILLEYTNKVANVHGDNHTETKEINRLFHEVAQELDLHMRKEEQVLFPYVKTLVIAKDNQQAKPEVPFGTVQNPIRMMEMEHENAGDIFKEIARLSNNYTPPEDACQTYQVLFSKLKEFEEDLHRHIHLENNILFPKAIALEENF
jgi:regulator of cell morphogenesis and NO signaling